LEDSKNEVEPVFCSGMLPKLILTVMRFSGLAGMSVAILLIEVSPTEELPY